MRWINLMQKLWNDDRGAIVTAEYMMVFGIMALGAAQGLSTLRDTATQEMKEMGTAVRETRLQYSPQIGKSKSQQPAAVSYAPRLPTQEATPSPCAGGVCP